MALYWEGGPSEPESQIVDVVDPLWEKVSSSANAVDQAATITIKGTDKYYASSDLTDKIKVLVHEKDAEAGVYTDVTSSVTITPDAATAINKSGTTDQIGDQYTISITGTGFATNVNQVRVRILEDAMLDESGNGNKETDFIVYNCLELTSSENVATSGFLDGDDETGIERQNIEKVVFVNSTADSTATGVQKVWDVSAAGDDSILAWTSQTSAPYTVYIGSDDEIFANVNSSYLFGYIGYAETCTETEVITNIDILNIKSVSSMDSMFGYCGYNAMTKLDLGENFDTSTATDMKLMFYNCGYKAMQELDLGPLFDTGEVQNMWCMFQNCGYTAMTSLDLGDEFDTSKVFAMQSMFEGCGYTAMETLDLGTLFDTSTVNSMDSMFYNCGYTAMTSLDLGDKFDTSNVISMKWMFYYCGGMSMETLDLGLLFDTSNVTNMYSMFNGCGWNAMTSLDLGDKFDTSKVTDMTWMFYYCGEIAMTSLDLGDKFDTSKVTTMGNMFNGCGYTALTSLDLGDLFYTTAVTDMSNMFAGCGNTAMTTLDLGPAFTKIASTNTDFITNTGKSGECVIYAPESIYSSRTAFKLNSTDTTNTIAYANGTINPIYRPEWTKVSSSIDESAKSLAVTVKGSAYESQTIDSNVNINYASDVTSTLSAGDIKVFIDGTDITDVTLEAVDAGTTSTNATSGKTEITQVITLSNFAEATRRAGIPYKEWSGNVSIQILGRGQATTTYAEKVLTDVYGNQSMMATDEVNGTWIDVIYEDPDSTTNINTSGTMFVDYMKPEFTYKWSDTTIGSGVSGDKKVKVMFDVTDKYFNSVTTDFITDNITITVLDDNTVVDPAKITKTLTKTQNIYYDATAGTNYVDVVIGEDGTETESGTGVGTKVGERYELVVSGLEQVDAEGYSDGYTYSGPMSISFASGMVKDNSNNTNNATTITIGIDETDGDPSTGDGGTAEIVDVVDPIWVLGDISLDTGMIKLRATDKHYSTSALAKEDITILVNGAESTAIVKSLTGPVEIVEGEVYEYTVQLSNVTIENAGLINFNPTNLEAEGLVTGDNGFQYRAENGGYITIDIAAGTITDTSGNKSDLINFEIGNIDATKPEAYDVQKIKNPTAGEIALIFNVTDRNYYPSDLVEIGDITVWLDGTQTDSITKKSLTSKEIKAIIDDEDERVVGHQYTLVLSDIVETHEEWLASGRKFKELSGTLQIKIDDTTSRDLNDNTINPDTTTISGFVDYIKPAFTYKYTESAQADPGDIDYEGKTFTMVFDVIDKYYSNSTLSINDLTIEIDGETPNWRETGGTTGVSKNLTSTDIKATFTKTTNEGFVNDEYVIGKQYTLVLSNLEQLEKLAGKDYLDYSGVITVAIPDGTITDTDGNGNNGTTITSGIDITGDVQSTEDSQIVDVVDPLWEKVSSSANTMEAAGGGTTISKATITVKGTDKYYASSALTEEKIKVLVHENGAEAGVLTDVTSSVTITPSTATPVYKTGTTDNQIGDEYTITVTGFAQDVNQVRIQIQEDAMMDDSGNGNKVTDLIVYNCLELTSSETEATSGFLGETSIDRQDIEKVVFVNSTDASTAEGVKKVWDASAAGDNTIKAWYSQSSAPYTVYIGSDWEIFANRNSSYLFAYIGYGEDSTEIETITSLSLLNTSSVTNMKSMFDSMGAKAMTSLNLGNFDTSNVTDMSSMFSNCGYYAMTSFDLGEKFDTTNVTNMNSMFNECGYSVMSTFDIGEKFDTINVTDMQYMFKKFGSGALTTLDLGSEFDTSNVGNMGSMFEECGYTAMTSLNLGNLFNTSSVTNMDAMFKKCGYTALTSLDLGSQFNTIEVTSMADMFYECGNQAMTSLNLGTLFNTSKVTNMSGMFYGCGNVALTSLDLGDIFYTTAATNMSNMFNGCGTTAMTTLDLGPAFTKIASTNTDFITNTGKSGVCVINAPESIYKNRTAFKLNSTDTTNTIAYANGTINPIYRPVWEKVSSSIDTDAKTLTVTLKGSAYKTKTVEVEVEGEDGTITTTQVQQPIYASDVTSTLETGDIQVFINGVDVTAKTRPEKLVNAGVESENPERTEIIHTFVLSNIEEAVRQTGVPYKEWSGNISIKIGGRGEATSTYGANVLTDVYGNQSMMETDEANGTWIDVTYSDTEVNANSNGTMFTDFTKPEFTYKWADTVIGSGLDGNKKVTVAFDITDKYFNNTTISADGLTITMIDDDTIVDPTKITKTLTKTQNIYYDATAGTNYVDVVIGEDGTETESGTGVGTKVGERYELLIEGLEQLDENGNADGTTYSGPMSISFPADIITDKSDNKNNATTITIGIDETDGDTTTQDGGSSEIVDVVDPIIMLDETDPNYSYRNALNSITRDLTTETGVVKVRIRLFDKYLDKASGTIADNLDSVIVKVQKPDGVTVIDDATKVTNPVTVAVREISRSSTQEVEYELTLSNFTTETEGFTTITIPKGIIKDSSGNGNKATEIYVGSINWTGDGDYTAFNNSIVDVTRPIWTKATSSITRDRENEIGTVTLKILGYDIYYRENTLDEDKITVYVNGVAKEIDKSLVEITDTTELTNLANQAGLDITGRTITDVIVGYTLTLSDFKDTDGSDLDGTVTIKIADDTIKDTSGNGNYTDIIEVGNPTWIETDVETDVDNPKYTAFRNSVVDFIKPVIKYQYTENVNPKLDRTEEEVDIIFTATDTNFLENNIGLEDMKIYIDDMLVYGTGVDSAVEITPRLATEAITDGSGNGFKYTLTLSELELDTILAGEIFERNSGVIKIVIAKDQVADTSGNKNIETTIIVDNDDGDDVNNGVIVDFINPTIFYHDKYINWNDRYALITIRATDRFYDENTVLDPEDITLYELNDDGEYIQITSISQDEITITPVENEYGYDFVIKLENFEEEFQMKINIPGGKIADTSQNYNDDTDIFLVLDSKKPSWKYVSTDTSNFESAGTISFNVKGVDKFLDIANSSLDVADLKVVLDGEVLLDGSDATDATKITVTHLGNDEDNSDDGEKSKSYKVTVTGLTEVGTYSLVFAEKTLIDDFDNESAATTISFSKSAISSNTGNYTNITYHITSDQENVHSSYVHELMSVNTTGTNFENTTYRPSTVGEIYNGGENPLFAEPMYDPEVDGYTVTSVYDPQSFAGWAEADSDGNPIYYTDATLTTVSETKTEFTRVYGLYDEIPNTVTNLKAIWQDATVVFVSNSAGDNANDGKLPTAPVKDLTTAYSKLNSSGTSENNIIVIMDAVEWSSNTTLSGNATITSLYAGVDYRETQSAELKISSNMIVNGDIIFDNIKLYANSTSISDETNMLISNYSGDITLGRGVTTPSDKYTFASIIGGNYESETSTGQLGTHTIRVEAGRYNNIVAGSSLESSTDTTKFVTHEVVIGNMRDAAVSRNDKLTITGYVTIGVNEEQCYPYGSSGSSDAYYQEYANVTLYSGTFTGANKFANASEDAVIYLRSINGETDGTITFSMYGGNVTGNIYGGARVATTYYTEIVNTMNFYGGTVTGNIFGQGATDTFSGSSNITLQGNFNITGNIFGGSNATAEGVGNGRGNTSILVNSSSTTITGSIYGGSNGVSNSGYMTGTTTITFKAGTVTNIYGSGNNSGNSSTTTITIENGTVTGKIVGGAYNAHGGSSATITVLGGIVQGNIYGGNENTSTQLDSDSTLQDVDIIIGDTDPTKAPTINGTIYGSGKYDKLDEVEIQLIECANITSVYAGADANSTTASAKIYLKGMTVNEIYGGGQSEGTVGEANIYLISGTATDVYGGGFGGTVISSNIQLGITETIEGTETVTGTATVTSIYGGPNTSGTVTTSNVTLKSGNLTNVFGGGNSASVGTSNVTLDGITIDSIHGGSKDAGLTTTSNVTLKTGTVTNVFGGGLDVGVTTANVTQQGATVTNIYGGNNSGTGSGGDTGTTNIEIVDSTVANVYGGNYLKGTTRYANITIHGTSTITGNVYGGGHKSEIGKSAETGSTTINIAGGTINGDINGGSEQSIVYGTTNINIGKDATDSIDSTLTGANINIIGTIYGAGDTSTSGEVTVVGDTHILMDNSTTSPIQYYTASGVEKSIYGSGNGGAIYSNGTTTDNSTIHIKDLGTSDSIYQLASIERTGELFIEESVIELTGSRDTVNGNYYTLNRITDALTIYNNTTLYTRRGFNMVGGFNSYSSITSYGAGTKATATIDGTEVTTNVDNRLYTLEGINLIFAKKEVTLSNKSTLAQSDWGEVNGMTFFGMYQVNSNTDVKQYDIYAPDFDYATGTSQGLFSAGTYVEGQYNSGHNITTDGFYTNVVDEATSTIIPEVIDTTNYQYYCDWIIGAETVNYDVNLIGSISGEQSMDEILLDYQYGQGAIYTLNEVSLNAFKTDVNLINPLEIPTISTNANNKFGLTMETDNSGWLNSAETNIYTASNGSFAGDTIYESDTSTTPGTIKFKLYNSINITEQRDLGNVNIVLIGQKPISDNENEAITFKIVIAVSLQTIVEEQKQQYIPSFTDSVDTELNYTTDSKVDLTYILYNNTATTPYADGDYRVISTTEQLPAGTRITLKDYQLGDGVNKVYYYHVTGASTEYEVVDGRYLYKLSNFIEMGSTDANYANNNSTYFHSDGYVFEKYDISIDFIDSNISTNKLAQETYLELRKSDTTVKYDNGNTEIKYNLYSGKNAILTETISNEGQTYSVVEDLEIPITIGASIKEQDNIMDTKYYDKIGGIALQIVKKAGETETRVELPEFQDFKLINANDATEVYESDTYGVIRVPIMEGLSTFTEDYKLTVSQSSVPYGTYTVQVHFYTSDDGKYYSKVPAVEKEFSIIFIDKTAGVVGITATDDSRIINKSTGLNLEGNSGVDMTVNINTPTSNTNVRVELYKRNETYTTVEGVSTYTGTSYTLVDISQYLEGTWESSGTANEYIVSPKETYVLGEEPESKTVEFEKALKSGITSGEYKLVFKSYNDDTLVQTIKKTFIVTP